MQKKNRGKILHIKGQQKKESFGVTHHETHTNTAFFKIMNLSIFFLIVYLHHCHMIRYHNHVFTY